MQSSPILMTLGYLLEKKKKSCDKQPIEKYWYALRCSHTIPLQIWSFSWFALLDDNFMSSKLKDTAYPHGRQTLLCSTTKSKDRPGIAQNAGSFAMLQIPSGFGDTKMKDYGRCVLVPYISDTDGGKLKERPRRDWNIKIPVLQLINMYLHLFGLQILFE